MQKGLNGKTEEQRLSTLCLLIPEQRSRGEA